MRSASRFNVRNARIASLFAAFVSSSAFAAVTLPPPASPAGYICRLLINEVPFPGERGFVSEEQTRLAMDALLRVLDARLKHIPAPYTQQQVAAVRASDIFDIITAGGEKGQFDGFYRDDAGRPVMVPRVTERIDNLLSIASKGAPGRFARLLEHAAAIAGAYAKGAINCADPHISVRIAEGDDATGRAYSWMSDDPRFHPGGNFLRIADADDGSLGANRFFTLRKEPQ